jgi:hypothetical protein
MKILPVKVSFMNTMNRVIDMLADYDPSATCSMFPLGDALMEIYKTDDVDRQEDWYKNYNPSALKVDWEKLFEDLTKQYSINGALATPEEAALHGLYGRLTCWKYDPEKLATVKSKLDEVEISPVEDSDELVRFQAGTSLNRAEKIQQGLRGGFVELEGEIGNKNYTHFEKYFGLQVNVPVISSARTDINRLRFYAENQSNKNASAPVVITGLIPKKFVFRERNDGEFAISVKDFDKMVNVEILSPNEFQSRYL